MWHLDVFPNALAYSIVCSVYIGVLLTFFASEWFGWTRSGLVIPGYLAPIILLNPIAGAIIVFEAILTYGIVRSLDLGARRFGLWSRVFGRGAFYQTLVVSMLVRVAMEGVLFYRMGSVLAGWSGLEIDAINKFYGIGFVCTPLLANMMVKPGLRRGLAGMAVMTGATALILKFVLVPFTNFSLVRLDLIYEDLAINFLTSPRAFIFLIVGAAFVLRMGTLQGYELGGLLIPALLSLTVIQPVKLLATFVEAVIIFLIGRRILQSRLVQGRTVEGLRLILLAFSIAFAIRFVEGHALDLLQLDVPPLELMGFGYLISSHLAISMWRHNSIGLVVRQVTVLAVSTFLLGTAVSIIVPASRAWMSESAAKFAPAGEIHAARLSDVLLAVKSEALGRRSPPRQANVLPDELAILRSAIRRLLAPHKPGDDNALAAAGTELAHIGYQVELLQPLAGTDRLDRPPRRLALLREVPAEGHPARNWLTLLIDLDTASEHVLAVPEPLNEIGALETGIALFLHLDARALILAGTPGEAYHPPVELRRALGRPYDLIMEQLAPFDIIEVHTGGDSPTFNTAGAERTATWLAAELEPLIGAALVTHVVPAGGQRVNSDLILHGRDVQRLLNAAAPRLPESAAVAGTGVNAPFALAAKQFILTEAELERTRFRPLTPSEILYWRQEVLGPVIAASRAQMSGEELAQQLAPVLFRCAALGARAEVTSLPGDQRRLFALWDTAGQAAVRPPLAALISLDDSVPLLIEAPAASNEIGTFEIALHLFQMTNARLLLLSPRPAGASDAVGDGSNASLYHLIHQSWAYELGKDGTTVHVRGAPVSAHSLRPGAVGVAELPVSPRSDDGLPRNQVVQTALRQLGFDGKRTMSAPDTAGLVGSSPAREFCRRAGFLFSALYFTLADRELYADRVFAAGAAARVSLALPVRELPVIDELAHIGAGRPLDIVPAGLVRAAELAARFVRGGDLHVFQIMATESQNSGWDAWIIHDPGLLCSFLLARQGAQVLAVNLNSRLPLDAPLPLSASVDDFTKKREAALALELTVEGAGQ